MPFKPQHDPEHLYFITATVLDWKPIFRVAPGTGLGATDGMIRIVLDSLDWHQRKSRWQLFAYVVMPNHLHALIKPIPPYTVSGVLQSFGSFTAHAILEQLRVEGRTELLVFFAQRQDHDPKKQHQIWQPIQAKNVYSETFLRQKLEYIHNNPVAKDWRLAEDRAEYVYSSACFYDRGVSPLIPVVDVWADVSEVGT